MASHFRSAEQQGSDGAEQPEAVVPEAAPQAEIADSNDSSASQSDPLEEVHVVTAAEPADPAEQPGFTSVFAPLADEDGPAVSRTGTPTVSFRNVTLIYPAQPNKPALDEVGLDIYPGEFVFIVGHSGSGKSNSPHSGTLQDS